MKQELIQMQKNNVRENMLNVASTLRNNKGIKQGKGLLYNEGNDSMCVMGVLGFRAGIPKEDLARKYGATGNRIWDKYGIEGEKAWEIILGDFERKTPPISSTVIITNDKSAIVPPVDGIMRNLTLGSTFQLNDAGYSFDEIADIIEAKANTL